MYFENEGTCTYMYFLPLKFSQYPSRPVPVPELFGKYPTRPVPKSKTPTRQTLLIGCSSSNSRDIDHGTPNWVLHNLAQVLCSSLSGDVDFNIQPAEAQLSRVMHIELWALAAPDCFSLIKLIFYWIPDRCSCYHHPLWELSRLLKVVDRRASNENGAKRSGINKPDLCFLGFVKYNE